MSFHYLSISKSGFFSTKLLRQNFENILILENLQNLTVFIFLNSEKHQKVNFLCIEGFINNNLMHRELITSKVFLLNIRLFSNYSNSISAHHLSVTLTIV